MKELCILDVAPVSVLALLLLLGTLALPVTSAAQPCTLYRTDDIQRARENVGRYGWAQHIVDGWKSSVSYIMQQDRDFVEEMIPHATPWPEYGQNCPVCVGKQSSMGECGLYRWSPRDPDKLVCKYCGTVYPNPKYPETGTLECPKMGQTFTYYETEAERAHPDEDPAKHAFRWASWPVHTSWSGIIRSKKLSYMCGRVLPLAKLYALTDEVQYAEKCAAILDTLARRYPNYLFHSYNGTYADCPPPEAAENLGRHGRGGKFPKDVIRNAFGLHQTDEYASLCNGFWGSGRISCSGGDGSTILNLLVAYDLIREATYPDGTAVLADEANKRIVNDLLLSGVHDAEQWNDINNKCGPGRALGAAAGILFERPDSARWALEGFETLMDRCFHFDGFCKESPSYSSMHLGLMRNIPEILRGYSDPEGYEPEEGERLDNLDPFNDIPRYRRALESMVRMIAPNGRYPTIGDTHYRAGLSSIWVEILADRYGDRYAGLLEEVQGASLADAGSEYALWYRNPDMKAADDAGLPLHTEWFPGWHVGVLRTPDPTGDTAFYLNAYGYHGHRHYDTLGILYHAFGRELASDRGYIWDDPRNAWTKSTLSHNLVTVDEESQARDPKKAGVLQLFGAAPGVEIVQARSDRAYEQCERYQRTCALIRLPGGGTYAADFFRVEGGKLHQYGFNCSGELSRLQPGTLEPLDQEHRWLNNFRAITPEGPVTATWQDDDIRMDLILLNDVDRFVVADAPGWRSDKGSELDKPPIQQILAERSGDEALASHYAALMVPYESETSPITEARLITDEPEALALEVKREGATDYIISALDDTERSYGPVSMTGRFGYVSVDGEGRVTRAYLLAGTDLRCGEVHIHIPAGRVKMEVERVSDRSFHLTDPVPEDM
ncbi:MAG: heparinase II/III family protein, partial [Armatimonadota bacterium]